MSQTQHTQPIDEITFVASYRGPDGEERFGEVFHLSFSTRDESLYLRPRAPSGAYLCGEETIPAHTTGHTFDFRKGRFQSQTPLKLSIHASGQVHVKRDEKDSQIVAGPLHMPRLVTIEDRHIATVFIDGLQQLRPLGRQLRSVGNQIDYVFPFGDAPTARILIYVNGVGPNFALTSNYVSLNRGKGRVLYAAFAGAADDIEPVDPQGFVVFTGWDPETGADVTAELPMLFIRCE